MLNGAKKILGESYNHFCKEMIEAAEMDALPVAFQLDEVCFLSCVDISDLFAQFENDTGLEMTGNLFRCPDCGKLHLLIEINNSGEEDEDKTYLQ